MSDSNSAGREDGVGHTVDDLLVGRADRGQHAAQSGARGVAVWLDYRTVGGITGANADVYANTFQ